MNNIIQTEIQTLNEQFSGESTENLLGYFLGRYGCRIALASSLSIEDQMLTDILLKINPQARIFTLDTGRLFPETYNLIDRTNLKYACKIEIFFPETMEVEEMVRSKGINLFYEGIEQRKLCCKVRKINPLKRAFETLDVWISGLRRDQSVTRHELQLIEWGGTNNLFKINPLINYSEEQVKEYIRKHQVPYNQLHDQGFPSIGCQPCTRAIKPGEDIRGGRWWWENPEHKECGLHKR